MPRRPWWQHAKQRESVITPMVTWMEKGESKSFATGDHLNEGVVHLLGKSRQQNQLPHLSSLLLSGEDPSTVLAGREWEAPTFAMPLYAFDQFEVRLVSLVCCLGEGMNLGMNLSFYVRLSCFGEKEHLLALIHSSHFSNCCYENNSQPEKP